MNSELFTKMVNMRQQANKDIIQHLTTLVNKYPELRFGQILAISNVIQYEHISCDSDQYIETVKDPFNEESVETLRRVNNKMNSLI
jgi:hypothetical protein